ncbi:MAG: nitrilase-related carbon-nitrogen hydrolase [bacterium]
MSDNNNISVACAQFLPRFGDLSYNLKRIEELTVKTDTHLIVFPELCTSGYEFRDGDEVRALAFAVPESSPYERLINLSVKEKKFLVIGFPEKAGDKVFNSCALLTPKGESFVYRKIHLFDREKLLFFPGDKDLEVVKTEIGNIGLMICFDWAFPEVARVLTLMGAHILCHPSNLVLQYCQRAMFARSVENGVYSLTANRIGTEERVGRRMTFTGASQILSPKGEILAQASPDQEEVISATIDPYLAENKMLTSNNHLIQDRRTQFYRALIHHQ